MDESSPDNLREKDLDESPEALLNAFNAHPEWSAPQRDAHLDRLVARVPRAQLVALLRARMRDLSGPEGEVLIRLVEANATTELLCELAEALEDQPDLAPERAWEALALLEEAGLLDDYPALAERWNELSEWLDEDASLDELAEQLEEDPEGVWLAIEGLEAVEPEVRAEIIWSLSEAPLRPGLIRFLRLLSFADDTITSSAALDALAARTEDDPRLTAAWAALAADHPRPEVAALARGRLGAAAETALVPVSGRDRPDPQLVHCLVTALDGRGVGQVVLSSRCGELRATAAFLCEMRRGVDEVRGRVTADSPLSDDTSFQELASQFDQDVLRDVPQTALRLLAGSLLLRGSELSPSLAYWLERTTPQGFRAAPFSAPFSDWNPVSLPFAELPARARAVLEACPTWLDQSSLTYEIAEEILLREGDAPPNPERDKGAYRYLFEHRLVGELELYRRMLFWMSIYWQAAGDEDMGRSALALAWQLSDAEYAVPGHPFTVALTTRSLATAQAALRAGRDPRHARPSRGE
jgi:hypothetical protein